MELFRSTYYSRLYRDFRAIEPKDYRAIIRFYEDQEADIRRLPFSEYFDLLVAYVEALFAIGAYHQHLLMVDQVIEAAISNDIPPQRGRLIFRDMLFYKAAAAYQVQSYALSIYILQELIRMQPQDQDAAMFLRKNLQQQQQRFFHYCRAVAISLFLLAAIVILLELLLVRPFYALYTEQVMGIRNLLFIFACLTLLLGRAIIFARSAWKVRQFIRSCQSS